MVESIDHGQTAITETSRRTNDKVMATTLIGAHGLEHMYGHSFAVLVTEIYKDLGLDPIQAGVLSAVRQITGGLTSVSSGFFVDMFEHRRAQVLSVSMALIGVGYFLVSISPTYTLILAALVLASAGSSLWHPPALGLLAQRFPQRRGLFISLHRSTGNVGVPPSLHRQRGGHDRAIGGRRSAGHNGLAVDHGRWDTDTADFGGIRFNTIVERRRT